MNKSAKTIFLGLLALAALLFVFWSPFSQEVNSSGNVPHDQLPVKGMVTMIDLGATACVPCKMMAPIMVRVEKKYQGKAVVVFIDVWKDKEPARRFRIRVIPTQIFFDKEGKEFYRHEGFMSEEAIDKVFQEMGVS
jgi:thioredoxin 1